MAAHLTQKQARVIREAIEHVRMTRANFGEIGSKGVELREADVTGFIVDRTRLYRETWIIAPLEQLLRDAGEAV